MRIIRMALVAGLIAGLSACSFLSNVSTNTLVAPQDLETVALATKDAKTSENDTPSNLAVVHALVQDSQKKCRDFVDSMFLRTAESNTALDVSSTIFSALGTVFTPIATVHALTAGSTIANGTKTSVDNNFLAGVTVAHVINAIQSSYGTAMKQYVDGLSSTDPAAAKFDPIVERSQILIIHSQCSLVAANGTIDGAIQPKAKSDTGPSNPASTTLVSIPFKATTEANAKDVAAKVVSLITADAGAKAQKLTAKTDAAPHDDTILLGDNATAALIWEPAVVSTKTSLAASLNSTSSPPKLTVMGTPGKDDTLVISAVAATKLSAGYAITAADTSANLIAQHLVGQINGDATFKAAGVKASQNGADVDLAVPAGIKVTWSASSSNGGNEQAVVDNSSSPTKITISAPAPQPGDKITVSGDAAVGGQAAAQAAAAAAVPAPADQSSAQSAPKKKAVRPLAIIPGTASALELQ